VLWLACSASVLAQSFTLTGRVTDEEMNPIELATVACVQQGKVTMTSLQGEYQLTLLSADSVVIRFSMIGYKTKTRVLRRPKGKLQLQVTLAEEATSLSEVDVKGQRIETTTQQQISTDALRGTPTASGNAVKRSFRAKQAYRLTPNSRRNTTCAAALSTKTRSI